MTSTSDSELEYLSPSFDPASLTVPRLRAVLVSHDVSYASSAKKAQLVDIFKQEIVPRSRKILAAHSQTKRTSRGITDMPSSQEGTVLDEGEHSGVMPPPPLPDTTRRKPNRNSRASIEDSTDKRSTTRRSNGDEKGATKHARASDSEADTGLDMKRPLVRRTRKSEIAPTVKVEESEEPAARPPLGEGVFSHENPFQSGSSPTTPNDGRRRSIAAGADRRKSSSRRRRAEGVGNAESPNVKQEDGIVVPTAKTLDIPITQSRRSRAREEYEENVETGEEFTPDEQNELLRDRAANGEVDILRPRRKRRQTASSGVSRSAPWIIVMTLFAGYAAWWRREKLEAGYCGVGKHSSSLTNVRLPEWASILQPECEFCPQHAYCYEALETKCEHDFMLTPHPLSLGGLVPLPPTCEPDGEKARRVKSVADRAVEELRERRARWECGDLVDDKGKEEPVVEIEESELKAKVSGKRRRGMSEAEFENLWSGAIGEIIGREEMISSTDDTSARTTNPRRLLTSTSLARLPVSCAIRRSARLALARYRVELAGLILLVSFVFAARSHIRTLRSDTARVPLLVSTTLDRLATQAALHAQGRAEESWISIGQLRDDVLRDEFSHVRREKIWKRVRDVVEMNANVRPSQRTGRSGEVSRVWEWIGYVGFLEDGRTGVGRRESKRVSFGGMAEGTASPSVDTMEMRIWDEGRPIY